MEHGGADAIRSKKVRSASGGVNLHTEVRKHLRAFQKRSLAFHRSRRKQNIPHAEVVTHRQESLQEGLLEIITEASDFAGRHHLDSQCGVCPIEPCKRELRR